MQIATKGITLIFFAWLISGTINAQEINLTEQLILHLPMNGDAQDYSGNGIPTIVAGPQLTEDRFGNPERAYLFDGIDDSININNNLPLITSRSFTISLWAKTLGKSFSIEETNVFFEQRHDIANGPSSTILFMGEYQGELTLFMRSSASPQSFKAQSVLSYDTQWHHFVARVDEEMHMEIYIDASLYCEADFGNEGDFVSLIDHVNLGTHHHTKGLFGAFNGIMDDVYIYNRALNFCEIEALYSGALLEER
jgi:hypothetical protein